jgi:2-dehydro-3-deoxyphosphogluconate aldolase/(4S)-4-hydroxy-2-oxoglutarate aldolase
MHNKEHITGLITENKLLPLFYNDSDEISIEILRALYDAGVRIVEYTNRGENALHNFKLLKKFTEENLPGMHLGIGTIKTKKQAKKFIDAGCDFIVSPIISKEIAEIADDKKLLWIPGCMTPTEIALAEELGAEIIKIFPGNALGPAFIKSVKEVFPDLKFIPTGGVEPEENNLREWFKAGVIAVGLGSKLISTTMVNDKNYQGIRHQTEKLIQILKEI